MEMKRKPRPFIFSDLTGAKVIKYNKVIKYFPIMKTFQKTIKETTNTVYVFVCGTGLNKGLNFLLKYNKALGIPFDSLVVADIAEARRIAKAW